MKKVRQQRIRFVSSFLHLRVLVQVWGAVGALMGGITREKKIARPHCHERYWDVRIYMINARRRS